MGLIFFLFTANYFLLPSDITILFRFSGACADSGVSMLEIHFETYKFKCRFSVNVAGWTIRYTHPKIVGTCPRGYFWEIRYFLKIILWIEVLIIRRSFGKIYGMVSDYTNKHCSFHTRNMNSSRQQAFWFINWRLNNKKFLSRLTIMDLSFPPIVT